MSQEPAAPAGSDLFAQTRAWANGRGLNLVGVVRADDFDDAQPTGRRARDLAPWCDSILVMASGGRFGWEYLRPRLGQALDTPREDSHPIDDWSAVIAAELLASLRALHIRGRAVMPSDRCTLNFVQLGELAGFGTVSPVMHQLLHPTYGPWVSLRAALLVEGAPFGEPALEVTAAFQPCEGCPQPCVDACPADVYSDAEPPRLVRCAARRTAGGCGTGCESRRACRVGGEHRYSPEEEAFRHAYALFAMRRHGAGGWRAAITGALRAPRPG